MRNLLALFGFAVIVFLGVGYYLEWYSFSSQADRIEFDVNKKKIGDDFGAAKRKAGEVVNEVTGGSK